MLSDIIEQCFSVKNDIFSFNMKNAFGYFITGILYYHFLYFILKLQENGAYVLSSPSMNVEEIYLKYMYIRGVTRVPN